MKKIAVLVGIFLLLGMTLTESAFAQRKREITIKLASLVPENTPWGAALNRMASEWSRVTNGEVKLVIYHNGSAGNEEDVLRKLRMNQIQAVVLTSFGLNTITPEIMALSCPFLIRNDQELDVVLDKIKPELEAKINEKGFYILAWAKSGWIKIFSRHPVFEPKDLKRQKVGSNATSPELTQAFKAMGYQIIPIGLNDVLIALNGGMIDAVYQSPIAAGGFQLFGVAKNMASINLAPFMGGIVMNNAAWRTIPDQYKPKIQEISRRIEKEISSSITQLEANAVTNMSRYGLVINQVSPAQERLWYQDMERVESSLIGTVFDRNIYEKINTILKNYRNGQ